jgi:FSR family fosmidomycin resistance protein-like MFS transporter
MEMNAYTSNNTLASPIESKAQLTLNILTYGISHAIIDAACAAVVFSNLNKMQSNLHDFVFLVILYNVLAFSLQAPFGLIIDRFKIPVIASIIGCVLTALSVISFQISLFSIILAGIGNSFFHVGGGIISLSIKQGKASIPGIYVAPGAMGLFIGTLVGKSGNFTVWPFIIALTISILAISLIKPPSINYDTKTDKNFEYLEVIILLLLISIIIRSLIGLSVDFPWKSNIYLLVCLTFGVVLGKAFGGIFADKFGWRRVSLISLLLSAPLVSFGVNYPLLSIFGIFLFNITMPVTLTAIANMLPGRSGFAFGLTTLALITGALPTFTELKLVFATKWIVLAIILLSALVLYIGLCLYLSCGFCFKQKKFLSISIDSKK